MGRERFKEDPPEEHHHDEGGPLSDDSDYNEYNDTDKSYVLNAVEVRQRRAQSSKNGGPTVASLKDHFTLSIPSSVVRYRNSRGAARVIEGNEFQFVLEESYNKETDRDEITIRRIQDSNEGLRLLRLTYTIVTAFWTGFLFVFCMQLLLFLFLDLAIQLGITDQQDAKGPAAAGAILGIIPLVHGLSAGMVIAGAFVMDTFRGHRLVRNFSFKKLSTLVVEWIFFAFFLGFPLLLMCFTLLSGTDDWWAITGVFWVSCIAFFFVLFTINVVFYEVRACMEVMRNRFNGMYATTRSVFVWNWSCPRFLSKLSSFFCCCHRR